jgi:formate dehydrogenase major subunit
MDEVASLTPLFAGVSYERLEGYRSLQWPVAKDGTDSPLLFKEKFPFDDGKAKFYPIEWIEPSEEPTAEFDLHLNNGRLLEHFEQGSMTYRTAGIKRMTPRTFVEISHELAEERGVTDGSYVQLRSPYGQVKVQVLVTDRVHGKELYMPLNSILEPVNKMTSSHLDRATHTPAFKELSVQMVVLNETGPNPLPRENFRWGHRTPQEGVEVENKWQRSDYYVPGTKHCDELVQIKTTTV